MAANGSNVSKKDMEKLYGALISPTMVQSSILTAFQGHA